MKERIGEIFGNFKGIPVDIPPTLRVMVSWKLSHQTKAAPILNWATHSGILAWEIPWTKEPGKLQSMASQRVGHN